MEDNVHFLTQKSFGIEYFIRSTLDEDDFYNQLDQYSTVLVSLNEGVENISYAPDGIISYIYHDGQTTAIGRNLYTDLDDEVRSDVFNAQSTGLITISGRIEGTQHSCTGFIVRNPIYEDEIFLGFVNMCFSKEYVEDLLGQLSSDIFDFDLFNQFDESMIGDLAYVSEEMYYYQPLCVKIYDTQVGLIIKSDYQKAYQTTNILFSSLTFIAFFGAGTGITYFYSKSKKYLKRTQELIFEDHLTLLSNRFKLESDTDVLIKNRTPFYLIYGDLNNFKNLNDSYGHTIGDIVLKTIANNLLIVCKKNTSIYRWGGDEFVFLSQEEDDSKILQLITEINQIMDLPVVISNQTYHVTISMGIVKYPQNGDTLNELLMYADIAMYNMKQSTTNNYSFFTAEIGSKYQEEKAIELLIAKLDLNTIEVFLQPVVNMKNNHIIGAESLLRIQNNGIYYNTQAVVNQAERTRDINNIDLKVFEISCEYLTKLHEINPDFILEVNFSVDSLNHETVNKIKNIMNQSSINANHIVIEATETSKIFNYKDVIEVLNELRDYGFKIAIDDFGSGYASLNHLARLPITHLKVDKGLVQNCFDQKNAMLMKSIKTLEESLGVIIVLEGIETQNQLDYFRTLNYDFYQGYYFSKPKPFDEIFDLIKKSYSK